MVIYTHKTFYIALIGQDIKIVLKPKKHNIFSKVLFLNLLNIIWFEFFLILMIFVMHDA